MTNREQPKLEKALAKHSTDCAEIYQRAWNSALPGYRRTISTEEFVSETEGETTTVALLEANVVGYISIWEPDFFIHHIYVDPDHQGKRVGSALLTQAIHLANGKPLSLKCETANTKALEFYQLKGFEDAGEAGVDDYGPWIKLERTATK